MRYARNLSQDVLDLDIMKDSLVLASKTWGVMQDSKAKDAVQEFLDIIQDYLDAKENIIRRYEFPGHHTFWSDIYVSSNILSRTKQSSAPK